MNKWTKDDIGDQMDRIVVVTGANSGIGFEAAKALAEKNAQVILACRNEERAEDAVQRIRGSFPGAGVSYMKLDLSDLSSVRDFSKRFSKDYGRLDILINNAGVMAPPYSKTRDGFELQFGTNHLGHFALTSLLWEKISSSGASRVVNVSSSAHKLGKINFEDLGWERRRYSKWNAYGDSKIANLYFTFELDRRLRDRGSPVLSLAAHPGWTATGLQRHVGSFRILNKLFAQSPEMGALPTIRAAVDEAAKGGEFYGPSGVFEMRGYPVKVDSNNLSHNKDVAKNLWDVSEKLTGVNFDV